jgi:YHS domain-containing protein
MSAATDPVCGTSVAIPQQELSEEYAGITYFFCSQACLERFIQDTDIFTLGGPTGDSATHDRGLRASTSGRPYVGPVIFEQSHT